MVPPACAVQGKNAMTQKGGRISEVSLTYHLSISKLSRPCWGALTHAKYEERHVLHTNRKANRKDLAFVERCCHGRESAQREAAKCAYKQKLDTAKGGRWRRYDTANGWP